tara:strand:- start:482 stop:919 length:438 start_codon:yes stop_codon:yes gene_type:complete
MTNYRNRDTITYGDGEIIFPNGIQAFDVQFAGTCAFSILQDNWVINYKNHRLIGVYIGIHYQQLILNYTGFLKIIRGYCVKDNELKKSVIEIQGVDYWELDNEKWEDDSSLWGTSNKTYLVKGEEKRTKINNLKNGLSKVPRRGY